MRLAALILLILAGCASPPTADPSTVTVECAHQCGSNLTACSSGFKLFPIVQQKQCNDNYDVCIKGCPARKPEAPTGKVSPLSVTERLKTVDELFRSGAISKEEYDAKRRDILNAL